MMKVIICTGRDGQAVVYGEIAGDELPLPGEKVRIKNARMVLSWMGRAGLFGLAKHGPEEGSRISCQVAATTCTAKQSLSVSAAAVEKIERWPDAE